MTDKLEPCRAMVGGRFCGMKAVHGVYSGRTMCLTCDSDTLNDYAWNTLQRDRLNSARWEEACGRGLVSKVDAEAIDRAIGETTSPDNGQKEGSNDG